MIIDHHKFIEDSAMRVGTSQIEITPEPGGELQGFAIREQPSRLIADPLFLRVLYLEEGERRFLWLVFDLLGFGVPQVDVFRIGIAKITGVPAEQIFVTTTHTHSGPGTASLNCCGAYAAEYVDSLKSKANNAALAAIHSSELCQMHFRETTCRLARDRQSHMINPDIDPRIPVFSWQTENGDFKAVLVSYSMHPVCLRGTMISADWPGYVSRHVSESLPGNPVTLVMSGACGNIDPPRVGGTYQEMQEMGQILVDTICDSHPDHLEKSRQIAASQFEVITKSLQLPLEGWSEEGIHNFANQCLNDSAGFDEFHDRFLQAIHAWRCNMLTQYRRTPAPWVEIPISALILGNQVLVGVGGEVFSHLARLVADETQSPYVLGMTNGSIGYIPVSSSYEANGYETSWSFVFYNRPRLQQGVLERIATEIRDIVPFRTKKREGAGAVFH